jgi:hypothetical protein
MNVRNNLTFEVVVVINKILEVFFKFGNFKIQAIRNFVNALRSFTPLHFCTLSRLR